MLRLCHSISEVVGLKYRTPKGRWDWCQRTTSRLVRWVSLCVWWWFHHRHHIRCQALKSKWTICTLPIRAQINISTLCCGLLPESKTTGCSSYRVLLILVFASCFIQKPLTPSWRIWFTQKTFTKRQRTSKVCLTAQLHSKHTPTATFTVTVCVCVCTRERPIPFSCLTLQTSSRGCVCLTWSYLSSCPQTLFIRVQIIETL